MGQEKARKTVWVPKSYEVRVSESSRSSAPDIRLEVQQWEAFYFGIPATDDSGIKILKRVRKRHNTGLV